MAIRIKILYKRLERGKEAWRGRRRTGQSDFIINKLSERKHSPWELGKSRVPYYIRRLLQPTVRDPRGTRADRYGQSSPSCESVPVWVLPSKCPIPNYRNRMHPCAKICIFRSHLLLLFCLHLPLLCVRLPHISISLEMVQSLEEENPNLHVSSAKSAAYSYAPSTHWVST